MVRCFFPQGLAQSAPADTICQDKNSSTLIKASGGPCLLLRSASPICFESVLCERPLKGIKKSLTYINTCTTDLHMNKVQLLNAIDLISVSYIQADVLSMRAISTSDGLVVILSHYQLHADKIAVKINTL